jgi:hypothetical protein
MRQSAFSPPGFSSPRFFRRLLMHDSISQTGCNSIMHQHPSSEQKTDFIFHKIQLFYHLLKWHRHCNFNAGYNNAPSSRRGSAGKSPQS